MPMWLVPVCSTLLSPEGGKVLMNLLLHFIPLQPDLAANEALLLQKIQLLCLMEVS